MYGDFVTITTGNSGTGGQYIRKNRQSYRIHLGFEGKVKSSDGGLVWDAGGDDILFPPFAGDRIYKVDFHSRIISYGSHRSHLYDTGSNILENDSFEIAAVVNPPYDYPDDLKWDWCSGCRGFGTVGIRPDSSADDGWSTGILRECAFYPYRADIPVEAQGMISVPEIGGVLGLTVTPTYEYARDQVYAWILSSSGITLTDITLPTST